MDEEELAKLTDLLGKLDPLIETLAAYFRTLDAAGIETAAELLRRQMTMIADGVLTQAIAMAAGDMPAALALG